MVTQSVLEKPAEEARFWGALQPNPQLLRKGRSVADGYARGWGLQFGDLKKKVTVDPLFKEAMRLCAGRTVVSENNRLNLYLLIRYFLRNLEGGHIIEFGTYRGGNALFMAILAKHLHPGMRVYALDTFQGMPATEAGIDAHSEGDFRDVDLKELRAYSAKHGIENLEFVQGLFQDTAPSLLTSRVGQVALAHIDCDIYSAVKFSYDCVKPFMVPRGYFVFDDANYASCIGATEAVEELVVQRDGLFSEQIYPHFVFRAP